MLLICATPEAMRRGYDSLLRAARDGRISKERINASLARIAEAKALAQPPLPLDMERYQALAEEISALNKKLNYVYGGAANAAGSAGASLAEGS